MQQIDDMKVDAAGIGPQVFSGARRMTEQKGIGLIHFEHDIHSPAQLFLDAAIKADSKGCNARLISPQEIRGVVGTRRGRRPTHDFFRYRNFVALCATVPAE
jgi:hypothetical protein